MVPPTGTWAGPGQTCKVLGEGPGWGSERGYPVGGGLGVPSGKLTVQAKPHAIRVRSRI
jgi:hypothetical protein